MLSYELRHKDRPAEIPGTWDDSTLIFKGKGPKDEIERIAKAIKTAIAGEPKTKEA
jgi:hypothetical protein